MKKVLILGAGGMLGQAMSRYFSVAGYRVEALTRSDFDIAREPAEKLAPRIAESDAIINCAGVIKPLIAKTPIEDVLRVNAVFPRNLAMLCKKAERPCFHVTTDCVYSGRRGGYDEEDLFDAEDVYGMTKNAGESETAMVLRTSIIGEERGQSRSLLEWARSQAGKEVNGFTNHLWNGVTTVQLAESIATILQKSLYQPGIFHVHSPNVVTKLELLQILSDAYDLKLSIKATQAAEACDRSLSSIHPLSARVCTKDIATQVREMRRFFAAATPAVSAA